MILDVIKYTTFYLTVVLMTLVLIYSYSKLSNIVFYKNKKNIIIIILNSIVINLNNIFSITGIKMIISILVSTITTKLIFKDNYKNSLFYNCIYIIVVTIYEVIFAIFLSNFIHFSIFNENLLAKVLYSVFISALLILTFKNKKITETINKFKLILLNKNNFFSILLIIVLIVNIVAISRTEEMTNNWIILDSSLVFIIIIFTFRTIINDKHVIYLLEDKNKLLKNSYKAYSDTIDEYRELKHNLNNDLLAVMSNLPDKYKTDINNVMIKYNKSSWISKLENIPEGLQGIVYLKSKEAAKNKIILNVYNKNKITINNKDYLEVCSIVGIFLDNAIEACKNGKFKSIEIIIKETEKELDIKVINPFNNIIDLNELGKKNYSTKKYKSGLGLNYISKIKNNNIKTKIQIINNLYISEIVYKLKNN